MLFVKGGPNILLFRNMVEFLHRKDLTGKKTGI